MMSELLTHSEMALGDEALVWYLGHETGTLVNDVSALKRRDTKLCSLYLLFTMRRHNI